LASEYINENKWVNTETPYEGLRIKRFQCTCKYQKSCK